MGSSFHRAEQEMEEHLSELCMCHWIVTLSPKIQAGLLFRCSVMCCWPTNRDTAAIGKTCLSWHRRSKTSLAAVEELLLYLTSIVFCVSNYEIVFTWSNPIERRPQHYSVFFTYELEFLSKLGVGYVRSNNVMYHSNCCTRDNLNTAMQRISTTQTLFPNA